MGLRYDRARLIKESLDIVAFAGQYTRLKRVGADSWQGRCVNPGHTDSTASFTVYEKTQSFYCFGCGIRGDVIALQMVISNCSFKESLETLAARCGIQTFHEPDRWQSHWNGALPIKDSPGLRYFQARGITVDTLLSCRPVIRFHSRLWHKETQREHPAILFLLEKANQQQCGIQRINLADDCTKKIEKATAKKMLGGAIGTKGAGIWFDDPTEIVLVAEGPENALSARQVLAFPTVSAVSASGMSNLELDPSIRELHIFADPDASGVGDKAATELADRASKQNIQAYLRGTQCQKLHMI